MATSLAAHLQIFRGSPSKKKKKLEQKLYSNLHDLLVNLSTTRGAWDAVATTLACGSVSVARGTNSSGIIIHCQISNSFHFEHCCVTLAYIQLQSSIWAYIIVLQYLFFSPFCGYCNHNWPNKKTTNFTTRWLTRQIHYTHDACVQSEL